MIKTFYRNGTLCIENAMNIEDGVHSDLNENRLHIKNHCLHRENGPAVEYLDGSEDWYQNGKLHRDNGPAISMPGPGQYGHNSHEEWWWHGERHREDGPAVIWGDHRKEWWLNDLKHRTDGPAVIYENGDVEWYVHGQLFHDINDWAKELGIFDTEDFVMMKLGYNL